MVIATSELHNPMKNAIFIYNIAGQAEVADKVHIFTYRHCGLRAAI